MINDEELRDNPPDPDWRPGMPKIDKNLQLYSADEPSPRCAASLIVESEAALPEDGWPDEVLSNHDKPRIAARVGEAQARVAMCCSCEHVFQLKAHDYRWYRLSGLEDMLGDRGRL